MAITENQVDPDPPTSDDPLIAAAQRGDAAKVERLCREGATVNARDKDDWTALDWAAGQGRAEVVRVLLAHGADVLATGKEQRRPYQIALAAGHLETAEMLAVAEDQADPSMAGERVWRPYCRAYLISELARFPDWSVSATPAPVAEDAADVADRPAGSARGPDEESADDAEPVAFLHSDLTVTRSMWHGEDVIFDQATDDWRKFCAEELGFQTPHDRDLVPVATR